MNKKRTSLSVAFVIGLLYVNTSAVTQAVAQEAKAKPKPNQVQLGNEEHEFIFAGRCINGKSYRIFSYEKNIEGHLKSFYDYEGPVGKGSVMTSAPPKTIAERICRQTAEIANGS